MNKLSKFIATLVLVLAVSAPASAWWGHPHYVFYYGPVAYPAQCFGINCVPPWGNNYIVVAAAGRMEIKTTKVGNRVIVDGGFAGMTGTLRKFWLKAGSHTIQIEDDYGKVLYRERIEVLAGKKLRLYPDEKH